jgi:ankyrin repeat protein
MRVLLDAGATVTPNAITVTLAHRETAPVERLLAAGQPMTLEIAAATGRIDDARRLLPGASPGEVQSSLGMAAINGQVEAARLALEAGADPDGFVPVHKHATPLHVAVLAEDLGLMELLTAHGARLDIRDRMWNGTPLGWAMHQGKAKAKTLLERLGASR